MLKNIDWKEQKERLIALLQHFPNTTAFTVAAILGAVGYAGYVRLVRATGGPTQALHAFVDAGIPGIALLVGLPAAACVIIYKLAHYREE